MLRKKKKIVRVCYDNRRGIEIRVRKQFKSNMKEDELESKRKKMFWELRERNRKKYSKF